jgi:hypothetical protein
MKKILATAAVVTAMISTPAMAWGEREQGILTGIVGTLILQDIARGNDHQRGHVGGRVIDRSYEYDRHSVNPYNESHKPGYARGRRTGEVCGTTTNYRRHTVDIIYTDCYGNVVDIVTRRR